MGKHGEQGLEHAHADFNQLHKSKISMPDPNLRLMSTMKDHFTRILTS